jgi:hypothetical protein
MRGARHCSVPVDSEYAVTKNVPAMITVSGFAAGKSTGVVKLSMRPVRSVRQRCLPVAASTASRNEPRCWSHSRTSVSPARIGEAAMP